MNRWDRLHNANLGKISRAVQDLYAKAIRAATQLAVFLGYVDPDKPFSFDQYPQAKGPFNDLMAVFRDSLYVAIVNGIRSEWTLANDKNDALSRRVFGDNVGKLTEAQYRRYFSNNLEALEAFTQRRTKGMNLSDRVWNLTSQFKAELEQGIDLGMRVGQSAEEMQRGLKQYLNNPDNFFRRFRYKEDEDADGNPIWGRKWKKRYWSDQENGYRWMDVDLNDYSYGRGVYRSSYKNARRLAVTENNIAYRTSDHLRWMESDFVVGIHIEPSNTNHDEPDICDVLKGDYPKEFKWTGWHPHCRCHATSILKTRKELDEDTRRILDGLEPTEGSVNQVKHMPKEFGAWMDHNADKIARSAANGNLPYFLRDNLDMLGGSLK